MSLMPQTPFQWFVPATTGTGMVPAAGYLVKFYSAGTTTPKTIYTDPELTVPFAAPGNIAVLDAYGRSLIYLGAGGYKMVVCQPDGTPVYTQDNISGESAFGTGFVDSYADLLTVNTTLNRYTYIGGYNAPGDGGEGMFYNETSSDSADGGYIQTSTFDPTKRWFRIPDENGMVRAASFGYIASTGSIQTSQMLAADAYAASIGATLLIAPQQGSGATLAAMTFTAPVVKFQSGTTGIRGVVGVPAIVFEGIVEAGTQKIFDRMTVTLSAPTQESRPEWFGATLDGTGADNLTAMTAWLDAGAGVFILPAGDWTYTGTFPTVTNPTMFYGTINGGRQGTQFATANSVALYGNYKIQASGATITTDGDTGGKIDNDWLVVGDNRGNTGTSATVYRVGGLIERVAFSGSGTAFTGGGATVYTRSILANTLSVDLSKLTLKVVGTYTGNWTGVFGSITVTLGGVNIVSSGFLSLAGNGGKFSGTCEIVRLSATSARTYSTSFDQGVTSTLPTQINIGSPATIPATGFAATQSLVVTGTLGGSPATGSGSIQYLELWYGPEAG